MTTVIGVSFKRAGKMYYFDPNGLELHTGDQVIVETARGMECGDVVTDLREVPDEEVVQPLKAVIRVATDEDRRRIAVNLRKEAEAFEIGQARIAHHQLEMKLVDVEYTREPKVSMAIKLLNAIYNKVEENEEHQTKGN